MNYEFDVDVDDIDARNWGWHDVNLIDGVGFSREGSALRASTRRNPRNLPCPPCKVENRLTPLDKARDTSATNALTALVAAV